MAIRSFARAVPLLLLSFETSAATIVATSCSQAAVADAIALASSGDRVTVPAGSCNWSGLTIPNTKRITLEGAGSQSTRITGSLPNLGTSGSRVTGFGFTVGGPHEVYGYGFRFDHNTVTATLWTDCIKVRDWVLPTNLSAARMPWGLIDNNTFTNCRINMEGTPFVTAADDDGLRQGILWALPIDYADPNGTVYIEDNIFQLTLSGNYNFLDANYGGSFVARYNTLFDGGFHELHSSQEGGNRSGKYAAFYGNVVDLRNNLSANGGYAYRLRGGSHILFGNLHVGAWGNPGIPLDNVRDYASAGRGGGQCNGSSTWDQNLAGQNGYACRDQIGRGPDSVVWRFVSPGANTQALVGAYFWSNRTPSGSPFPAFAINWSSAFPGWVPGHIQANRDYFDHQLSFDGTAGVGCGPLAGRPATCTVGVGYWASTQSCTNLAGRVGPRPATPIAGTLYKCIATNTWAPYFTPVAYPHPAASGDSPVALFADGFE